MIYCVEDDPNIRELIIYTLKTGGFEAKGFSDSISFFNEMKTKFPSLILLDIMLPGTDGLTILKKLKENAATSDIPVIMLTAKGTEFDKVQGLDMGADDYITKPFGVLELISRVKSVLRRVEPKTKNNVLKAGDITMDTAKRMVMAGNTEIKLTAKEFELLYYLMSNVDIVLTRDKLLDKIWGFDFEGETRTLDVHIRSLRKKLGKYGKAIETVRGVGYRIGAL
ncbi:MAG: response regulator transcription factor [Clostridiaceae bacterium]|nr:response regulator transcription factor [Clostridiaceae bacterium]